MIRQHLFDRRAPADPMFRWRGGEVSRVEALSDAVFAFALTLLVVSLAVPGTFDDLTHTIRSFPAFAVCFALLINVWYYHYKFFRRYGLEDFPTIVLNGVFLFVVLFYVYPLKFVFGLLIDPLFGVTSAAVAGAPVHPGQLRTMMLFFSAGFMAISSLLILLHLRAWQLRSALELDELERAMTLHSMVTQGVTLGVATTSLGLAALGGGLLAWSGLIYFLMAPLHTLWGWYAGRRAKSIRDRLDRRVGAG